MIYINPRVRGADGNDATREADGNETPREAVPNDGSPPVPATSESDARSTRLREKLKAIRAARSKASKDAPGSQSPSPPEPERIAPTTIAPSKIVTRVRAKPKKK